MVSIIIVNYHVKKELFGCIESIINSNPTNKYEIIIVDNDEEKTIQKELHKKFPKVIYVLNENKGFGQANNTGAKIAKGEYLFFLNPDTKIFPHTIDNLVASLEKNKKTGIVAPLLHDMRGYPYQQGALELTPIRGIACLSFINKIFPNNPISKKYFLNGWDKKTTKQVDVIPGTAFMIRENIFRDLGGFDEKFFLYFEEFDLCKRAGALGWKIFIDPSAKVFHTWGASTSQSENIKNIFLKSRFYYFKKHFGFLPALLTEAFLRINKYTLMLLFILILGLFLLTYRLQETMPFIGDQAWFYLSARDFLHSGKIPLVGIPSSHPWLHQGALWTYILSLGFLTLGYSPYTGAYISILLDILAVFFMYKLGSSMFSQKIGTIAALLYATSPIVIFNARMPYHTSPIPLLTLLYLWSLVQWVRGHTKYFPAALLLLVLLYNFEIATFPLAIVFFMVLSFGLFRKKKWSPNILSYKFLILSSIAFAIPMLPMLIYDFYHGFPQTFGFLGWIGYKILVLFGYPPLDPANAPPTFVNIPSFIANFNKKLVFAPDNLIALVITIFSLGFFYKTLLDNFLTKKNKAANIILGLTFTFSFLGVIAAKTTSDAYLPILFPTSILIIAIFFDRLLNAIAGTEAEVIPLKLVSQYLIILSIILISFVNAYSILTLMNGNEFLNRLSAAKKVVSQAGGRRYNLVGEGTGSQFPSFTMNYEYLTWWLGHGPSKNEEKLQFIISEAEKGIKVKDLLLP